MVAIASRKSSLIATNALVVGLYPDLKMRAPRP
jgi:hypothetical protein